MTRSSKVGHRDRRRRLLAIAALWALAVSFGTGLLVSDPAAAVELDLKPQLGLEIGRTPAQYYIYFDCAAVSDRCDEEVTGFRRHRRLEIRNISCYGKVNPPGDVLYFTAAAIESDGSNAGLQFFPATFITETTTRIFIGGGETFFIVGPKAKLYLRAQGTMDITEASCTISGDLVFY